MNQQRMEYQVKGKVKYDLFFEGKKKKKFHVAFSLWAADKMPLHKDYKLQKPIVWETQILKNKCQTGKKQQVPLQTYPLHSSLSNQDQSPPLQLCDARPPYPHGSQMLGQFTRKCWHLHSFFCSVTVQSHRHPVMAAEQREACCAPRPRLCSSTHAATRNQWHWVWHK